MLTIPIDVTRHNRRYEIFIEAGLCADWRQAVSDRVEAASYLVVADRAVAGLLDLPANGETDGDWRYLWLTPGEEWKTLGQYASLCDQALALGITRGTVVVALGGGVTGDIAGFMAATLLRGLRLVQVPTTLLSQVDSSVGGKTGVNAARGKNLIGAFHQPETVLIDPLFLKTLPRREFLAGMAEVVKTAILSSSGFFTYLRQNRDKLLAMDPEPLSRAIAECCRAKAAIVAQDETEAGKRALLNLGHTFGHALEALAGYDGRVVHGEAVAVGTVLASRLARDKGYLAAPRYQEIVDGCRELDLPVRIADLGKHTDNPPKWDTLLSGTALNDALAKDKKRGAARLNLVLPHGIGDCRIEGGYAVSEVADFMRAAHGG